jgi:hypothetical protein
MSRCVIHIGMHKTGSTSIQRSLHGHVDDRFFYANLGHDANHSLAIYSMFVESPEKHHHLHRSAGRDANAVQAYVEQVTSDLNRSIEAAQGRTLLISGEDISVIPERFLSKLRDEFRARFDEVSVVAYVRSPAGFIASHFQQRVKNASVDAVDPGLMYRNYRDTFLKFDNVFGTACVTLWKYDPQTFPNGCAVRDFCQRLGIALPSERIVRLNESLSRQAVAALYTYRKFGFELGAKTLTGGEGMAIGKRIGGADKFRFSPDVVALTLEQNSADIEWMEARLGQSLRDELGLYRPGDIRTEDDLLDPDPSLLGRLRALLEEDGERDIRVETQEDVARVVHAIRERQSTERRNERRKEAGHRKWYRALKSEPAPVSALPSLGTPKPPTSAEVVSAQSHSAAPITNDGKAIVHIAEIVDALQRNHPTALAGASRNEVRGLVTHMFQYINERVSGVEEGTVTFPGLGHFRVMKAETAADGTKDVRIRYRPVK